MVDGRGGNAETETDWEGTAARNISTAPANTHTTTVLPAEQGSMMASENEPHTQPPGVTFQSAGATRREMQLRGTVFRGFVISYFNSYKC